MSKHYRAGSHLTVTVSGEKGYLSDHQMINFKAKHTIPEIMSDRELNKNLCDFAKHEGCENCDVIKSCLFGTEHLKRQQKVVEGC